MPEGDLGVEGTMGFVGLAEAVVRFGWPGCTPLNE